MKLTELFLNRFLYKDNQQNLETKDSSYNAANVLEAEVPAIASGGAAQDINMGNVTINGAQLTPGTVPQTVLDVSNWGWGQTCAFSSTDSDTVSWASGVFTSAGGETYTISAGNTGNMSAKNYIYLDLNISDTTYQKTTTPATAVGIGKVLIAVAQNSTSPVLATFMLSEATQIVGDNILANTINASKIVAGSITATQISSSYIYAGTISADNVTAGTLTGSTIRTAASGQRIIISGVDHSILFYDSDGVLEGEMWADPGGGGELITECGGGWVLKTGGTTAVEAGPTDIGFYRNLIPTSNGSKDLGTGGLAFRNLYLTGDIDCDDINADNIYGDIYPDDGIDALIEDPYGTSFLFSNGILILEF
jgi:hypothetical protein